MLKQWIKSVTPAKKVKADILFPRLIFILSTSILILFGLVMVFSASNVEALSNNESPYSYLFKQTLFCIIGLILAAIVWRVIPYNVWQSNTIIFAILAFLFVLMFATLVGGTDILGARRWIYIGPVSIQPSEYAKIVLVLAIAKLYDDYANNISSPKACLLSILIICFLFMGLILIGQSDLGTTIICGVGILTLLWISGIPRKQILLIIGLCVLLALIFVFGFSYRQSRLAFLDPYNDGQGGYGSGYQLIRSFYAFGEGGFFGVGLGNSYEKYQYLPEAETDFIFSIVGEELGLIGCIIILSIFTAFVVSGLFIAFRSNSRFVAATSSAFVVMIGFQACLNILCVVGLAPTTGKPLPFISAGGSSIIASLIMVGFVLSGSEQDALPDKYERRRENFKAGSSIVTKIEKKKTVSVVNNTKDNLKKLTNDKLENRQSVKSYTYKRKPNNLGFKPSNFSRKTIEQKRPLATHKNANVSKRDFGNSKQRMDNSNRKNKQLNNKPNLFKRRKK